MQFSLLMGYIGVIVTIAIYAIYIPSILKGKTKPHIFSWLIWTVFTAIVFFIQVFSGGGAGTWTTGLTTVACVFIFLLCFKYGTPDITRSDKISFAFGVVSILAWYLTDDPFLTLCFIFIAETLAFYPTFRKSYVDPTSEPLSAYYLSTLKFVFSAAALEAYNFYTLAYPLYFGFVYLVFTAMILYRRRVLSI